MAINIVLLEPEIPANTGNIGRSCAATGSRLHLIRPLGFSLSEKHLRRAGMDYWRKLDLSIYDDYEDFLQKNPDARIFYFSSKGRKRYTDEAFSDNDYLFFGKESAGIPEEILLRHPETCLRIPMLKENRSLNLSNSVSVALFEALRQLDFPGLEDQGKLHRLSWDDAAPAAEN